MSLSRYIKSSSHGGRLYWKFKILFLSLLIISCRSENKGDGIPDKSPEVKQDNPSSDKIVKEAPPAPSSNYKAKASELINYRDVDILLLEDLIHQEINKVRDSYQLPILGKNNVLRNAATDQNNYQIIKGDLSHTQENTKKRNVGDRISHYGGGFQTMAENVIYEGFVIRTSGNKKDIIAPSYQDQAKKMVRSWMSSPGHRKNIENPKFDKVGTAVGYNAELHAVFATQVFGRAF